MHRRTVITGSGALAASLLAGCIGSADNGHDENNPSNGDDENSGSGGDPRTVTVSNGGEVEAEPDLAVIRAGVEVTGEDATEVRDELAQRSEDFREALLAAGIDEGDITTGRFNIRERIDERRMQEDGVRPESEEELEEYIYYRGTHEFTIEVRDVDEVGEVIDEAVGGGADEIGRVQFTLSDARREDLREEALEEAIDAATAEAAFVADQLDAEIVEATTVDTSGGRVSPVYESAPMDDVDDAPGTDLHPDDVSVSATVDITFTIE